MESVGGPSVLVPVRILREDGCLAWRRVQETNMLLVSSGWLASYNRPHFSSPDPRFRITTLAFLSGTDPRISNAGSGDLGAG